MFLANNNSIVNHLRTALDKLDGYKDVLAELVRCLTVVVVWWLLC